MPSQIEASCATTSGGGILKYPTNSRRISAVVFLGFLLVPLCELAATDVEGDEDETHYEVMVGPSFKRFHRKFGRYPKTWIELGTQSSCGGYYPSQRKHFPKPGEAIIWKPSECALSYKIVFATKDRFRVVALAKGHVVSAYENYKATYYKTPYHNHGPGRVRSISCRVTDCGG